MSKQADLVLAGFIRLTEEEQQQVKDRIDDYLRASKAKKIILNETILSKVNLGPLSQGGCPCCGK